MVVKCLLVQREDFVSVPRISKAVSVYLMVF
jgi:hypothetical protein